jgi:hypothetical protein
MLHTLARAFSSGEHDKERRTMARNLTDRAGRAARSLPAAMGAGIFLAIFSTGCHYLTGDLRAGSQAAAAASLRTLNQCAQAYKDAHPDEGFPATLASLGPAGSRCIDERLAAGEKSGYKIAYTPGARDENGRVSAYAATAQPIRYGYNGDANFFTDESGVLRGVWKDRPATARDPPLGG